MSTAEPHHGIVVGVDGSPPSKVAVDWAAREAAMRNLPLTLIHVIPSPTVAMWSEVPTPPELAEQLETHGQEVLRDARTIAEQATAGCDSISVDAEVITAGVLPSLIDLSKEANMIVVGCRGLGAIGRRLLGSVSWGLLHHANCPVAVIHEEDPLMTDSRQWLLSWWVSMVHRRRSRPRRSPSTRRRAAASNLSPSMRGVIGPHMLGRRLRHAARFQASRGRTCRKMPRRFWPSGWRDGTSVTPT